MASQERTFGMPGRCGHRGQPVQGSQSFRAASLRQSALARKNQESPAPGAFVLLRQKK